MEVRDTCRGNRDWWEAGAVVAVLVTQVVLITPTGPSVLMLRVYAVEGVRPVFVKVCTPLSTSGLEHTVEEDTGIRVACRVGSVQVQVIVVGWYVVLWRFVMLAGGTGTGEAGAVVDVLVTMVALINPMGPSVFMLRVYAVEGVRPVLLKVCTPLATSCWNTPLRKTRAFV